LNKELKELQQEMRFFGCLPCHNNGYPETPCDIHHILDTGRRIDEEHVLPLCPQHHRGDNLFVTPRHPFKKQFEIENGTEKKLLLQMWDILEYEGECKI